MTSHIDSKENFARRLRKERTERKLSLRALSFKGCSAAYIHRIENGDRTPKEAVIRELASRLGVTYDWLAKGIKAGDPKIRVENYPGFFQKDILILEVIARGIVVARAKKPSATTQQIFVEAALIASAELAKQ